MPAQARSPRLLGQFRDPLPSASARAVGSSGASLSRSRDRPECDDAKRPPLVQGTLRALARVACTTAPSTADAKANGPATAAATTVCRDVQSLCAKPFTASSAAATVRNATVAMTASRIAAAATIDPVARGRRRRRSRAASSYTECAPSSLVTPKRALYLL